MALPAQATLQRPRFLVPPSESLMCPICQDAFTDPVITSGCHHSFCAACISKCLEFEQSCPLCRGRLQSQDLHPNLALAGLVGELPVMCTYRDVGCTEQIRLDCYVSHVRSCGFAPSQCEFHNQGCDFEGALKELKLHQTSCVFHKMRTYIQTTEKRITSLEETVQSQSKLIVELRQLFKSAVDAVAANLPIPASVITPMELDTTEAAGATLEPGPSRMIAHRSSGSLPRLARRDTTWPNGQIACTATISNRSGVTAVLYDNSRLYTGAYDGKIRMFDMTSGDLLKTTDAHNLSIWSMAMDARNDRLFSAGTDGAIKIWSSINETMTPVDQLKSHTGKVYSIKLQGNLVLSASSDKTIKLWDMNTLECVQTLEGHTAGVNSLQLLPGNQLASVSSDKSIKIWDLSTASLLHSISHLPSDTLDVAYGSGLLFASTLDSGISAFSLQNFARVGSFMGHRWEVWQLEYTSGVLFSGSHDHTIRRWDIRKFQSTAELTGHKGYIHSLVAADTGLISGCGDKTVKLWESSQIA